MGASDAVYLLEKAGYRTKTNGFGRIYRQSPTPGSPCAKGDLITLELGFDELEIMRNDSIAKADSIQGPVLSAVPIETRPKEEKKVTAPVVTSPATVKPSSAIKNTKKPASKTKAKPKEKPKPDQAAIDRWKAKVAAQKALDKKNQAAKKNTETTKKTQQ
jgi:hypothetical protein